MPAVRPQSADRFEIQPLEARVMLAATPGSVLTKQMRQTLLNNMSINIKSSLQTKLNSNDLAGFDTQLLSYMNTRTSGQFYFTPADVTTYVSYITSNLNVSDVTGRADDVLQNLYPLQDDANDSLTLPEDIDWIYTGYSTNPATIHTLNRQAFWVDLSLAYRYSGDGAYADKLISQLADWSSQAPALSNPDSWESQDPPWWRLNAAIRAENWAWTYSLMVGTPKWSKEANTLFLCKALEHGQFLYKVTPDDLTSNQAFLQAKGLLCVALLFPEFSASTSWKLKAQDMVFSTMDAQFFPDGGHYEQSPGYASVVIRGLLQAKVLEAKNGITWSDARNQQITRAVDAVYELMTPDGNHPAMGDAYRDDESQLWFAADLAQNTDRWPLARANAKDVWIYGPDAVAPYMGNPGHPPLGARPDTYALPNAGNYLMRSGSDSNARQILFDAGPKGGTHGHLDLFNFELFGYGKPLISDPGLYMYDSSAKRTWAISTPAHNTISIDGLNHGNLDGANNPGIVVDKWDVADDHVQVTAHHYGYAFLSGGPVVSRSIWYDYDGTMLVVDWIEGVESHTAKTSFLIPGTSTTRDLANGMIRSTSSGGNVKIQTLLRPGQTAAAKTTGIFTSNNPPPNASDPATQFYVTQSGSYVVFATLITAYNGVTPPSDISASWLTTPAKGKPLQLTLVRGSDVRDITFTPPTLKYPTSKGGVAASYSDVAYDSKGRLHMVFQDRNDLHLKYTVRSTNGSWSPIQVVDANAKVGYYPSIAIDGNDNASVAYYDGVNGDLKYAEYRKGFWTVKKVDSRGTTGLFPSLAFTRKNNPTITYYDKSKGDLRMAGATSTGWALATIDGGSVGTKDVGRYSQLMLDPARPTASKWSILYEDTSGKRYVYAVQGSIGGGVQKNGYTFFTVSSAPSLGGYTSLAFDSKNRPAVSFYDAATSALRYAISQGSTTSGGVEFSAKTVTSTGTTGLYTNLFFTSSGNATIFYFDKTQNKAMKAVFSSGKWSTAALSRGGQELHTSRYAGKTAFTKLNQGQGLIEVMIV
jgi:hypothetical protein